MASLNEALPPHARPAIVYRSSIARGLIGLAIMPALPIIPALILFSSFLADHPPVLRDYLNLALFVYLVLVVFTTMAGGAGWMLLRFRRIESTLNYAMCGLALSLVWGLMHDMVRDSLDPMNFHVILLIAAVGAIDAMVFWWIARTRVPA